MEQTESQKRIEEFKNRCMEASKELHCDFFFIPQYQMQKDGSFTTRVIAQIIDTKEQGEKSPLQVADIIK